MVFALKFKILKSYTWPLRVLFGPIILAVVRIRIRIQGFDDQKWGKLYIWKNFLIFFWSKIAIYLSLGLHKGRPSYRGSLQPLKENIQLFKAWNFSIFIKNYYPPGSGSCLVCWTREHAFRHLFTTAHPLLHGTHHEKTSAMFLGLLDPDPLVRGTDIRIFLVYHQENPWVLLLYEFLSFKTDVNVPSKSNKKKDLSGSVPKSHGSATLEKAKFKED